MADNYAGETELRQSFAIIPARGGSVRLPGKNLAVVGGLPLVVRSVRHAKWMGSIPIVTTDDPQVAEVCTEEGATMVERPPSLATAEASTEESVRHALNVVGVGDQDICFLLQPTSPFRNRATLRSVLQRLRQAPDSLVLTVGRVAKHSSWVRLLLEDGYLIATQDKECYVYPTGAVYAFTAERLRAIHQFGELSQQGVLAPVEHCVDIDEALDLEIARAVAASGGGDDVVDFQVGRS